MHMLYTILSIYFTLCNMHPGEYSVLPLGRYDVHDNGSRLGGQAPIGAVGEALVFCFLFSCTSTCVS